MKKPRVLAVTLARGGSKSIPKKNIRPLNGVPLIAHTIVEAQKSEHISRYVVSTDCEEIQSIAIQFGAEAPFLRPDNLATDTATALAADQHALKWIEHDEHVEYDFFVELLVTNPMKSSEDIDGAIEKLINTGADSVIGVTKLDDHHPIRVKKIEDDLITDFCLPEIPETHRQQLTPEAYIRNGAIYASRRDLILAGKRYGTTNSRPYIMQADRSVNIDGEIDFLMAEILISKYHGDRIFNKN